MLLSIRVVLLISLVMGFGLTGRADYFNTVVEPRPGKDKFEKAEYRLWIPEDVKVIRGIIVKQHGCGPGARKTGPEHAHDLQWQQLARKWDCALMGTRMWAPNENCGTWVSIQNGSGDAFETAIKRFAQASKHPELEIVPWCLWGHSGGAGWVMGMSYEHPERVIAVVPRSAGGKRDFSEHGIFQVPLLASIGEQETDPKTKYHKMTVGVKALIKWGREKDAPWALSIHPNCGHETRNTRLLAIRFFDACLAQRLPDARIISKMKIPGLKPLKIKDGFYVQDSGHEKVKRHNPKQPDPRSWVPREDIALSWQQFHKTGDMNDTSPPPSPTQVKVTQLKPGQIEVTWSAHADMESGIARFIIERNGKKVGELKGKVIKKFNPKGNYLYWNYGDQPYVLAPMRFVDQSKGASIRNKYTVQSVNGSGLKSE